MRKILFILLCCFFLAATASATTYVTNIQSNAGYADMNGMLVSVDFTNANTADVTDASWGVIDASNQKSGVSGSGWSLAYTGGDTYNDTTWWTLNSTAAISSLTINAIAGGTLFDIISGGYSYLGTTGSDLGWWDGNGKFGTDTSGAIGLITWAFTNDVALDNSLLVGDLFGTLTLTFGSDFWASLSPTNVLGFRFQLDTDKATVVPEPATMALMGVGLLGLAGIGSRTRKNTKK